MSELEPCPFCGGEAHTIEPARYGKPWGVRCECGAFLGFEYTEAEAIEAWNTRAYTTDEIMLSGMLVPGLPVEDVRVFGMTLDELRQMMKRDAERRQTCEVESKIFIEGEYVPCPYYEYEMKCGGQFRWDWSEPPTHCPECGGKVVSE